MKKIYSTEGPVKRPRRRIGEMPDYLKNELKKLDPTERLKLRLRAQFAAL